MIGFFDHYPEFFRKEAVNAFPNRLNQRYKALIENNKDIICNKRILDIASHDGRWSFAALQNDAAHITGIDVVPNDVKIANQIMEKYKISKNRYNFILGNVHEEIIKIKPNIIDTVFCFGFFYHTLDHLNFLSKITKLKPKNVIFDTFISSSPSLIIDVYEEKHRKGGMRLAGRPSKRALELMLKYYGLVNIQYYNWHEKKIEDWSNLDDYNKNIHITFSAEFNKKGNFNNYI